MARGLEENSRFLTGTRIAWAGLSLICSFAAALAISGKIGIYLNYSIK